ncbi:MAG: hypothetical protein WBO10_08930 [Pyrinomonadaceae bacterium]
MKKRERSPKTKKAAKPVKKPRLVFSDENWRKWTNQQRLDWLQNQYDQLTASDGRIRAAVAATDVDIEGIADSIALMKIHVEADKHWAKWSLEEKLASRQRLYERLKHDRAKYGPRTGATDVELRAVESQIEYFPHQAAGLEQWNDMSEQERLDWLRKTHKMLTADDSALAKTIKTPPEYLDEIVLRMAIHESLIIGKAECDKWSDEETMIHTERLYYLYTKNGGEGARIFGKSKEFIATMRSDIAKMKEMSVQLKIVEQRMKGEADRLLRKIDQIGRRSPTVSREDVLGKKGH